MRQARTTSIDEVIGARIRIRRKEINLSQDALAKQIGVTFQQIQKYERGLNRVSAATLYRLASALVCSVSDFLPEQNEDVKLQAAALKGPNGADRSTLLAAFNRIRTPLLRKTLLTVARELARADEENEARREGTPAKRPRK